MYIFATPPPPLHCLLQLSWKALPIVCVLKIKDIDSFIDPWHTYTMINLLKANKKDIYNNKKDVNLLSFFAKI